MTVTLTFYGGVREIGGNKILLQDGDTSLFLDFGTSFKRRYGYFEEFLRPRPGAGMLDFLELGLVPRLKGIYRPDLLPEDLIQQYMPDSPEVKLDGILLSHAHVDHSGYISFLRDDIPVYTTAMSAFIGKAMQDSGQSDIEREVCYANLRKLAGNYLSTEKNLGLRPFCFMDNQKLSDEASAFWAKTPMVSKKLVPHPVPDSNRKVGSLPLRYFPVDHSIPGACSFALETSAGWFCYSGDLRLHGRNGKLTGQAIDGMAALHPEVLICEGTRARMESGTRHEAGASEEDVHHAALKHIRKYEGELVIADFGPRNIDRLLIFHEIARETRRKLAVLAKDAFLLEAMRLVSSQMPDFRREPDVLIYEDLKSQSKNWEKDIRESYRGKIITPEEIHRHPGDYIICFSFWDLKNLIDINPESGIYIYSSSEAHDEEGKMDFWRLSNWLEHFNITPIGLPRGKQDDPPDKWKVPQGEENLHASGHAGADDLLAIVRRIAPKILVPVHSLRPEFYREELSDSDIKVVLPEFEQSLSFSS